MEYEHGPDTEKALQKIQEWVERGKSYETLFLIYLNISSLPPLPNNLISLNLRGSNITYLNNLPSSLKQLICTETLISSLENLPPSLKKLHIDNTQISLLPELPLSLTELACSGLSLTSLPNLPPNLKYLYISSTQISVLPELPNTLITLECGNSLLHSLPNIPNNLHYIRCSGTNISEFPDFPDSLKVLICDECPNLFIQKKKDEAPQQFQKRLKIINEILRRDEIILRCKAIKEDLIIKTWHPKRMFDWCLDVEEQEYLRSCE